MSVPSPREEPVAAHVQVVRGAPDEVELAALVAGLVAQAAPPEDGPVPTAAWTDRRRALPRRPAPSPGLGSWRWSLHP